MASNVAMPGAAASGVPHTPVAVSQASPAGQSACEPQPHVPGVTQAGVGLAQHTLPHPVPPGTAVHPVADMLGTQRKQGVRRTRLAARVDGAADVAARRRHARSTRRSLLRRPFPP